METITLEELFYDDISRVIIKPREDSLVIHIDATAVMSEHEYEGHVDLYWEVLMLLLDKLKTRLKHSGFENVEENGLLASICYS